MYVHNLNPIAISIGPLNIYWYSLVYVFAFLTIYYLLHKKRKEFGLGKKEVENFVFWFIIGVIAGARLFEVLIWNLSYYITNPLKIIAVWEGGMALHGGIIGGLIVGMWFCKKHKINFMKFADFLIIPTVFFLAIGRIANFVNGELVGTITSVAWCVKFPMYEGCRHAVQLYAAAGRFLVFGALVWIKKNMKYKVGYLFWMALLLLGIKRFLTDFYRFDARWLGLSLGQYLSLIMAIIAGYWMWKKYRKD